ncbi:hypothetical protein V495_01190 [Pseudogymnoascus sp. VKM F-4514 (FW-929)]|nr:hypothetical protein V495_01190 [Pseudogymnoascus sp. VKM F-4514 (FW-929)]
MRLSTHLAAAAWAVGLTTAADLAPRECSFNDINFNSTNLDTLANCAVHSYLCPGNDDILLYDTAARPAGCKKLRYNVFFGDYNMTGPLVVPGINETTQLSLHGYTLQRRNNSAPTGIDLEVRPLRVDSIEFPDLVSTKSGLSIKYATNVSSVKFPKLESVMGVELEIDLSGGPAISLSFPKLRIVDNVKVVGKIDALDFPALNMSGIINVTSTGDLDCVAFAATVVNTTTEPTEYRNFDSLHCTSKKNSIHTRPTPAEDTSGSSGASWFRGDILLLAVLIGSASLSTISQYQQASIYYKSFCIARYVVLDLKVLLSISANFQDPKPRRPETKYPQIAVPLASAAIVPIIAPLLVMPCHGNERETIRPSVESRRSRPALAKWPAVAARLVLVAHGETRQYACAVVVGPLLADVSESVSTIGVSNQRRRVHIDAFPLSTLRPNLPRRRYYKAVIYPTNCLVIDETSAFQCCLCTKHFSRNDLLHAHLKRHEKGGGKQGTPSARGLNRRAAIPEPAPSNGVKQSSSASPPQQQMPMRQGFVPVHAPVPASVPAQLQSYESWVPAIGSIGYGVGMNGQEPLPQFSAGMMDGVGSQQQMMQPGWQVPYPFQDGGIFGMGGEPYIEITPGGEYLDPFAEGYGQVGDQDMGFDTEMAQGVTGVEVTEEVVAEECSMSQGVYEKLTAELPDLTKLYLGDRASLLQLYNQGLDYSNLCMPFFHRPTLNLETLPPQLILTICSLGACTSVDENTRETGKAIHTHVWRQTFLAAMDARQVDIWTLQTMVLLEHIGFYALSRPAHEKADVFHAMVVTLARRSSLLAQNFDSSNGSRLPLEKRWEEWAERETIIRVAYTIFVQDVDYTIHFMHPALLTLGMLKLPLPAPPSLWLAKSAADWSRQTEKSRPPPRTSSLRTLRSALELLIPVKCTHSRPRHRAARELFCSSAFTLQILIHGLASAVFEHKFRGLDAGCSPGLQLLQVRDFEDGLSSWMACFERLAPETGCMELARSALVTYNFTSILLRESLSDILMAAGTAYSWGRAVTPQRAQDAFVPLREGGPPAAGTGALGCSRWEAKKLVLWAYALGLSRLHSAKAGHPQPAQALWVVQAGKLKSADPAGRSAAGASGSDGAALGGILGRGFAKPEIGVAEIEGIKADVRLAMRMVRGRLEGSSWELSHEAMRVLDALLDKNGFMD